MNTENNKILAAFVGLNLFHNSKEFEKLYSNVDAIKDDTLYIINEGKLNWYTTRDLKYHESIDALVPIWEKIEDLGYAIIVQPDAVRIIDYNTEDKSYMGGKFICMGSRLTIDQTLIGAFNMCFLQFIHQYNKQTENEH